MQTATFIDTVDGYYEDMRLYRVDPAIEFRRIIFLSEDYDESDDMTQYVVVSGTTLPNAGIGTYILPADKDGRVLSWCGLPGSYRGGFDHAEALRRAGYEVQEESTVNVNACQNEVNDG